MAASTSPVTDRSARYICKSSRSCVGVEPTKEPCPWTVNQMVSAATMPDAVAEPRTPNRSAAQMMSGKMAYSSPVGGRSNTAVRPSRLTSSTPASAARAGGHRVRRACAQASSRGAISRSPIASPDHHTNQRCPAAARSIMPLAHRLSTPIVALTRGLTSAARVTSAKTSRSPAREGRKSATRRSSRTAVTASRVFPAAMPAAPAAGTPLVQLSRKAPSAMPGQKRTPNRRSVASATPVGGQADETTFWATAASSPSLAAPK